MNTKFQSLKKIMQSNVPWVILIVQLIIFGLVTDNFLTVRNVTNILGQNAFVIMASLGVALLMMSGPLDISIGSQMSFLGVIAGILLTKTEIPIVLTFLIIIVLSIIMNMINTLLAYKLNITQFVVSVAAMTVYQGLSYTISGGGASSRLPEIVRFLGNGNVGVMPVSVIAAFVFFLIMSFFLTKTYLGRYVYALGGNEEASRLAGINVFQIKMMIAGICGFFVALSTLLLIGRLGTAQSTAGLGTEFVIITGVLVGGISLRGGEGKLHGVVAGILIMAIFVNGMQMAGLGVYAQQIVRGLVMLLAIAFDTYQFNRRQKVQSTRTKEA